MKTALITALLGILLAGGCAKQYVEPEISFENEAEQDEYIIYSISIEHVYLRNLLSHNKNPIESFVVIAETNDLGEYWIKNFAADLDDREIPQEVIEDWMMENRTTEPLLWKFDFSYQYYLLEVLKEL